MEQDISISIDDDRRAFDLEMDPNYDKHTNEYKMLYSDGIV